DRERERERERKTHRQRERERKTHRQRERWRETYSERIIKERRRTKKNDPIQFFSIANTHFLKACLVSSKLYTQIPKPLTQNAKPFIHPAKGNFAFKTVLCHLKRVLCFLM